ncbi:hypothetical protein GH141_04105, partial [bacterium]|nr:hypothetical protein [bacterium]
MIGIILGSIGGVLVVVLLVILVVLISRQRKQQEERERIRKEEAEKIKEKLIKLEALASNPAEMKTLAEINKRLEA